eukprot:16234077-Heterocapsa_arctica.AAC.1
MGDPRQDEHQGVGAPIRELRGLGVLDPDANHHEEDAFADGPLNLRPVVEVRELRARQGVAHAPRELLPAVLIRGAAVDHPRE